jgi:hypothetical protein
MARPKKSAADLIRTGARAGRIKARQHEEAVAAGTHKPAPATPFKPRSQFLDDFMQQYRWETDSFASRIVPNETLMLDLGNRPFNWRSDHVLTKCRAHANDVIHGETKRGPISLGHCIKFLENLEHGSATGIHADPMAFQNVLTILETFGDPGWHLNMWDLFFVANFMGWKRETGEFVSDDSDLLTLDDFSIVAIDRAFDAVEAAV